MKFDKYLFGWRAVVAGLVFLLLGLLSFIIASEFQLLFGASFAMVLLGVGMLIAALANKILGITFDDFKERVKGKAIFHGIMAIDCEQPNTQTDLWIFEWLGIENAYVKEQFSISKIGMVRKLSKKNRAQSTKMYEQFATSPYLSQLEKSNLARTLERFWVDTGSQECSRNSLNTLIAKL